ncbi:MAG TPA: hypothetical protein VGM68_11395 [Rhizomicrobium sp.]
MAVGDNSIARPAQLLQRQAIVIKKSRVGLQRDCPLEENYGFQRAIALEQIGEIYMRIRIVRLAGNSAAIAILRLVKSAQRAQCRAEV